MNDMLREALQEFIGLLKQLLTNLLGPNGKEWGDEFKKFLRKETCWVPGKLNPYMNHVVSGNLKATDGRRTIVGARKMFPGYFDSDYVNWGTDVPGQPTEETPFEVLELVKNGKFAQIFGAFGRPLDELCLSQDKILEFVENHSDKLHPKGWATFFLFKVGDEFFVANVRRIDDGQLEASVARLSDDFVWNAEYRSRFVVPQLPLVV